LAKEYEKEGIIFLSLNPGTVNTDMFRLAGGKEEKIPPGEPTAQESAVGQLNVCLIFFLSILFLLFYSLFCIFSRSFLYFLSISSR
jgi:NAD(P)-dependent dehydrogenase (short-subunit alcohol dehydrogenase family)